MTTDENITISSYDQFKAKYEPTLSKLDVNRTTNPFYLIHGLPKDLKQSTSPVYLAGGMPHESMFPFKHVSVKYRDTPGVLSELDGSSIAENESSKSYEIPLYSDDSVKEQQCDIARAFQYSDTVGLESLRQFTRWGQKKPKIW